MEFLEQETETEHVPHTDEDVRDSSSLPSSDGSDVTIRQNSKFRMPISENNYDKEASLEEQLKRLKNSRSGSKNTKDLKRNDAIVSGSSKTEDGSEVAEASVDTVEISTEVYKETRLIKQKSEGDFRKEALKAGQETPGEVKDASNKEAGDNKPDSDPRQDGKYEEGEDALKIIDRVKQRNNFE